MLEPDHTKQASDPLWRALQGRGGKRGYKQKLKHISVGLSESHYSKRYPWVLQSGHDFAKSWGFTGNPNVLQGAGTWAVESISSESSVEVVQHSVAAGSG